MKLTKKDRLALRDSLDDAAWEVVARHIPEVDQRRPEEWSPEEKAAFDLVHEVKDRLADKLREDMPAPNSVPLVTRFRRAVKELNAVLEAARSGPYPNANYYVTDACLNLMKGDSHDMRTMRPLKGNVIAMEDMPRTGGGDW